MEITLLVSLALAPCIAWVVYIYLRDKYEREPLRLLLLCFILGGLSTLPAIVCEQWIAKIPVISKSTFLTTFLGIGLVEEGWKLFFLMIIPFRSKAYNEPLDGIVYAVMVGMGFAAAENILYVIEGGVNTGILRSFTAVPAHAVFGILMGFFLGYAKFSPSWKGGYIFLALWIPAFIHGLYDYFLFERSREGLWLGPSAR